MGNKNYYQEMIENTTSFVMLGCGESVLSAM
jgi:hypothetical protein